MGMRLKARTPYPTCACNYVKTCRGPNYPTTKCTTHNLVPDDSGNADGYIRYVCGGMGQRLQIRIVLAMGKAGSTVSGTGKFCPRRGGGGMTSDNVPYSAHNHRPHCFSTTMYR
jgi:hypothetical protein